MNNTIVLYWPEGGAVDHSAYKIYSLLTPGTADIFNIEEVQPEKLMEYSFIIAGGSTVGSETWEEVSGNNQWILFLKKCKESGINLQGIKFAVFGLGDQILYPHHFVNDMAEIHKAFIAMGATPKGEWPSEGYRFSASRAHHDGKFVGLALDEVNEEEKSDERISKWIKQLI
ncbi:MAG: flavodoxin domain-containing protein [Bacteroidales bacterium]